MKRKLLTITAIAAATIFFAGCKSPEYKAANQSIGAIKDSIEAAKSCNDLNDKLNTSFHAATEKYNAVKDSISIFAYYFSFCQIIYKSLK